LGLLPKHIGGGMVKFIDAVNMSAAAFQGIG
jgi:hypothetical protein